MDFITRGYHRRLVHSIPHSRRVPSVPGCRPARESLPRISRHHPTMACFSSDTNVARTADKCPLLHVPGITVVCGGSHGPTRSTSPRGLLLTPPLQIPRTLAPIWWVTRGIPAGPRTLGRVVCQNRGSAANRSLCRLAGRSTSLSPSISAQWRGFVMVGTYDAVRKPAPCQRDKEMPGTRGKQSTLTECAPGAPPLQSTRPTRFSTAPRLYMSAANPSPFPLLSLITFSPVLQAQPTNRPRQPHPYSGTLLLESETGDRRIQRRHPTFCFRCTGRSSSSVVIAYRPLCPV